MHFKPINGAAYCITGTIKSLGNKSSRFNCICAGRDGQDFKFITLRTRINELDETETAPLVFWLKPSEMDDICIKQLA